jgi:hypothetical protein
MPDLILLLTAAVALAGIIVLVVMRQLAGGR